MPVGVVCLNVEIAERSDQSQRTHSSRGAARRHLVTTTTTRSYPCSVPEYIDGADGNVATAEPLQSMAGRVKESCEGENTFLSLILLAGFFLKFSNIFL